MVRAFLSHISEDKLVAQRIKTALSRDFFGLLDIFLSSDTQRIAAGEKWLESIEQALQESTFLVVLCSPEPVRRPWINFEAGAAWMRKIPLIPICHASLRPRDFLIPLSLRQGIAIDDPNGLESLYNRVAKELSCQAPQ
ncbi:MAG TPA: toll/interleukin-1 receptor domain-containing protein [Bryobacteraceae bacterium]|nr:toll/interleukin-1 receptor domain-containing protein [Bryobacteraceae bacterium]